MAESCSCSPTLQYPRLAAAFLLLAPLRFVLMTGIIVQFAVVCMVLGAIPGDWSKRMVARLGMLHSRAVLFVLGVLWINVTKHNKPGEARGGGGEDDDAMSARAGVVSNHVGWIDILVHMALFFPSFVAKDGVAKMAVVGTIARNMRCIFVQREAKTKEYKGVRPPSRPTPQKSLPLSLLRPHASPGSPRPGPTCRCQGMSRRE